MLLEYLRKDCEIHSTSWGEGTAYLNKLGYNCRDVAAVDVGWGEHDRMSFKKTVRGLPKLYGSFGIQVYEEIEMIKQESPKLVLSDSRLSAIIAASYEGIPSVLLTNQLRINLPILKGKMMRFLERVNGETLAAFWSFSDAIIVPDLPPPYTISEYSLSPLMVVKNKLIYTGFLTKAIPSERDQERDRPVVFFSVTGPLVSRRWIKPMMLKAAKLLSDSGKADVIFSAGEPNGSQDAIKVGNMVYYEWCPDTDQKMLESDLVVTRSGHSTISKLIMAGKPSILIPIPMHGEQWGNAKKCEEMGFAKSCDQLSTAPSELFRIIKESLNDESLSNSARKIRDIAKRYDGIRNAVNIIRKMLS